ncbi:MAG TPA: YciI family protein [Stenomitos sp.]
MFIVLLRYVQPLEHVDALLGAHREFLARHYASGRFLLSGRKQPRTGGVILASSANQQELEALLAQDPFAEAGVAAYEVIPFQPTQYHPDIARLLESAIAAGTDVNP